MPQEFEYFAILTNKGTEKLAQYLQSGEKLTINWVVVGDGNGSIPMPDPGRTALVHEVWRGPAQVTGDLVNKNVIKATSVIPTDVGGWNVREIGLIDQDGELFAIANAPGYPKISIADGINNDMCVGMRVAVSNQAGINVKVDGTVIIATLHDIEEHDNNEDAHRGHFKNKKIHVSTDDRENWDNPLIVATVLLTSEDWGRDPEGVTFIQDVTGQLPEETVLPNMDLTIKADPNLVAQMVDKDIGLVAEQTGGKIVVHALREAPDINMYLQVSLYRSKSGEEKTYYSNLLGNPGEIGTPLPLPIEKGSIHLEDQSTAEQLKIHGTHINPSLDWAATRVVRGENVGPIGPNDGVQIMDGTATEFTDTNNLKAGVRYIYAYFPRNEAGNYQMSATTAEITIPTKKPLAPTSVSVKDTTDKNAFAATLTIQLPVDVYRDHIVVVRKEGSAPASMSDGTVVYTGKDTTVRDTTSTNYGIDYHWAVYTVNAEGTACDTPARANLSLKPIVPEQVTQTSAADASAPEYGYRVMIKYKKPADVNVYKIMVRRKAGEMPATSIDGEQVYEGSSEIFYNKPAFSSQAYYYRAFTVNQSGQMNDEQDGAVASVTLAAKEPGSVTNLAATDEKGTTTGSFDLPVVMLEGKEVVNRFVAGYVVIQKEGSTPESETDGEVIASTDIDPAITSKTVTFSKTEQKNGANLFITVFLKNHAGSYFWSNGQVVNIVPKVLPIYTYTGQHTLLKDNAEQGWWRIKFLSSGVLTWLSEDTEIDVFLVGGGAGGSSREPASETGLVDIGGGGGGGYTKTVKRLSVQKNQRIQITIGAGGSAGNRGGATSFDSQSVNGGDGKYGGCGGGANSIVNQYANKAVAGNGGSNGNSGGQGIYISRRSDNVQVATTGIGQGSTTREFGDAGAELYSGGGGGAAAHHLGVSENVSSGSGGTGTPRLAKSGTGGRSGDGQYLSVGGSAGGGYGGGGGGGIKLTYSSVDLSDSTACGAGAQGIVIIRDARN